MAEKDIVEKQLESYSDVMADILNVIIYQGREVVKGEELYLVAARTQFKAAGKIHEQERDVVFRRIKDGKPVALFGLENQTVEDQDMVFRNDSYDGASSKEQVLQHIRAKNKKMNIPKDPSYPVVTLVLYYGLDHWTAPTTYLDALEAEDDPDLLPFIPDRKINVVEIAFMTRRQVMMFKSDFRFVVDYFVQKRETGKYIPPNWPIKHVDATLKAMSVLTGDNSFEEIYNKYNSQEGEDVTMREIYDNAIQEGRTDQLKECIIALKGCISPELMAEKFNLPLQQVLDILAEADKAED